MSNIKRGLGFLPYYDFPEQPTRLKEALANVGQGLSTPFLLGADIQKMLSPYNFVPKAAEFLTQPNPEYVKQLDDEFKSTILSGQPIENEPIQLGSGVMMSPGESRARFGSPSYGQMPDLAIGDDAEAIQQKLEDIRIDKNVATDPKGGDKSLEGGAEAIEGLMNKSIMDYIDNIRGTSPEQAKTLAKYKEEFAEATGLDVSGKPDTKDALVAFGLALMQNKAGKGFNVGNMLKSVGSAGEKAMPLLQKAKAEAKAAGASAGKYALEMRAADKAKAEKAMEREDYFIVPNIGGGLSGDRAGILSDEGRRIPLNKSELNKLTNNKDFSDKFTILPGSMYDAVLAETMKTPEAAELYDTKTPRKLELFGEGASDLFTIETWRPLPQSGVEAKLVGKGTDTYKALSYAARDLQKAKEKFIEAMPLVEGTNIFRFGLDKIDAAASAFGINFREGATPTQKLTLFLTKLQAQNAKEILGEAGKTISDADRALVASIVGDLKAGSTPEELQEKLNGLFNDIIIKKEQQIIDALATLDRYSGRKVSESLSGGDITDEERKELESYAKGVTA